MRATVRIPAHRSRRTGAGAHIGARRGTRADGSGAPAPLRGEIVLAADGVHEKALPIAFSANPAILSALPYHEYTMGSPEMPLQVPFRDEFRHRHLLDGRTLAIGHSLGSHQGRHEGRRSHNVTEPQ